MEENNEKLERTGVPTGKREGIFIVLTLLWAMLLVNVVSFSGFCAFRNSAMVEWVVNQQRGSSN